MKYWVLIIIGVSLVLMISSFWNDSLIVDEIPHVGAGYSYLEKLDYRLNPEHPPLGKMVGALPLLFLNLKQEAFQTSFWEKHINGQWEFGRSFIFKTGNDANLITRAVKFPMLAFFVLSALMVWHWTKKLYSKKAGLIALILFCFSTTVMAHSRFVTTDVPALFGVLFSTYFFLKYLQEPTSKNLWIAGLIFGVAQLTKFSLFLLAPYFLLMALVWGLIQTKKSFTIQFIVSTVLIFIVGFIFIVWPVYTTITSDYPIERQYNDTKTLLSSFGRRSLADTTTYLSGNPLTRGLAQYGLGLLMVVQRTSGGNTTYFLGDISITAWQKYFPIVYALKEPLAWWFLVLVVILSLTLKLKRFEFILKDGARWIKNHFAEIGMLLWIMIYWITSIKSNLNIGVRHLLPIYPFTIILVSGQLAAIAQSLKHKLQNNPEQISAKFNGASNAKFKTLFFAFSFIIYASLGWYIYENLRVWPYYLTYFNQIAGGPSGGYRYVVDSNLDWGQDLKRLSEWVKLNKINAIYLDYFGWSDPAYYLGNKLLYLHAGQYKSAEDFLRQNPNGGYLAVSATFFMGSRENITSSYAWLDNYKPLTTIGNSIFVWKF